LAALAAAGEQVAAATGPVTLVEQLVVVQLLAALATALVHEATSVGPELTMLQVVVR
jgi:hypothetical protein